jgi:virginiamycin B lyase
MPKVLWLGAAALSFAWSAAAQFRGTYSNMAEYGLPNGNGNAFPLGIAAGPDGALWFTEDYGNKIGRITTAGAITEYAVPTGRSQPWGIAAGSDGALWFTELIGNKIGRIDIAGNIAEYPIPTANCYPAGIAAGPDGALWFAEDNAYQIGRIDTAGEITEYAVLAGGAGPYPYSIAAGPDGALWFTERSDFGNKIGRIATSGKVAQYPVPTPVSNPSGIAAGPDGAMWFTEHAANKIGRISMRGDITEYLVPTANSGPYWIAAGPDGALWFTAAHQIGRITTTGTITQYPPQVAGFLNGITAGPDGGLWFASSVHDRIGRAPACGLGFGARFADGTLSMKFDLGIDTPATFDILIHTASGVGRPFSREIPAVAPPRAFNMIWNGLPNLGDVTVEAVLTAGAGQAVCAEWNGVNTAQ